MGPLALNVTPATSTPAKVPKLPETNNGPTTNSPPKHLTASDISSPHELTAFVESLLEQLETKFDDMSSQILDRMNQMSSRVDSLEASIQDIINGDTPAGVVQSPSGTKRSSGG